MIQPTGVDAFSTENMKRCREYVFSMQCDLDNAVAKDEAETIRSIVHRIVKSQAVRRVAVDTITRINDGKHTAGIDGVALPRKKTRDVQKQWRWELLESIDIKAKPQAIRRVYIPKSNGKKRPLGIPTIHDRVVQAIIKLAIEPMKTSVTHIHDGLDFLGFHVRRWENKGRFQSNLKGKGGTTLLIKPSHDKIQRHRERFKEIVKSSGTLTQAELIKRLNMTIRGFTNYYRHVSSKQIFHDLGHYHWHTLYKWGTRRHPKKNKSWVEQRYFFRKDSHKSWFGDKEKNLWILHPDKVSIVYHQSLTRGKRVFNYDDAEYWTEREVKKTQKVVDSYVASLYKKQKGHCETCGEVITKMDIDMKWTHIHHVKPKAYSGDWKLRNLRLIHSECHKELHSRFTLKEMSDLADAGEEYWVLNIIFV